VDQMLGVYVLGQKSDAPLLQEIARGVNDRVEVGSEISTAIIKRGGMYVPLRFLRRHVRLTALGCSKLFFSIYKRV